MNKKALGINLPAAVLSVISAAAIVLVYLFVKPALLNAENSFNTGTACLKATSSPLKCSVNTDSQTILVEIKIKN